MRRLLLFTTILIGTIFCVSCIKDPDNPERSAQQYKAPTCLITNPNNGQVIQQGSPINIWVNAEDSDGDIDIVRFYVDSYEAGLTTSYPYSYYWETSYEELGVHTLKAIAFDNDGNSTSDEINVTLQEEVIGSKPVAAFYANKTEISQGEIVYFYDQSTNNPTSRYWQFGDGYTSTESNPTHIYNGFGNYTVSLTAGNEYGSDVETKENYISTYEIEFPYVKSTSAPTIDGIINYNDPWDLVDWIDIRSCSPNNTTNNMSSQFKMVHDNENIYIVVNVYDATPNNDKKVITETYYRDCVELFFSMKSSGFATTDYVAGDHQIRCQRYDSDGEYIVGQEGRNSGTIWSIDPDVLRTLNYAIIEEGDRYTIEFAFDIDELVNGSDFDGRNLRFDILVSDNSTGGKTDRTQICFWNSSSNDQWQNTSVLGNIALY